MYSIDMVDEFLTVFISDPVNDDPENAAAGATRARAIIEQDFMFRFQCSFIRLVVSNVMPQDALQLFISKHSTRYHLGAIFQKTKTFCKVW